MTLALTATLVGFHPFDQGSPLRPFPARAADCQNIKQTAYAAGNRSGLTNVTGVRGDIRWANPTLCPLANGGFTGEMVTLCINGQCPVWVQTGWVKRKGWTSAKMLCEFAPDGPGRVVQEFFVTPVTHEYKFQRHVIGGDDVWSCFEDGYRHWGYTTDCLNFDKGTWVNAQGETNSLYSVIGKELPDRLVFTDLFYYVASSCWCTINLNSVDASLPQYGADEPAPGEMRNWTD